MNAVLGVSGSVAAYRAADLARELMRSGFTVRVCLTDAAQEFVSVSLFEALTGQPCLVDTFEEPERGRMAHIDWARTADVVVVAPATANTLNKLAGGVGDDMLTTLCLASTKPLVLAPAMNPQMYLHDATQASLSVLAERGAEIVEPLEGDVACGENGQGKLASIPAIVAAVISVVSESSVLKGRRVLITSGPTREPIDDVRYITNRSSGKMGSALARSALRLGAEVTVVAGPQTARLPAGATVVRVETAHEMHDAALGLSGFDYIVGAAAVADYHVTNRVSGKMRRSSESVSLELAPNPDIIAALAAANPSATVIGFAAEPTSDLSIASAKLKRKGLFAIAANDVSQTGQGFDTETNRLDLVFADGRTVSSGLVSKAQCAKWFWEQILSARG
ncbi:MAG: bifunctional phosphopantothenoylcysteine decarboxylase/phosphopantothenate--cysteine ligase CoaBC [Armatimonadota bacterium]